MATTNPITADGLPAASSNSTGVMGSDIAWAPQPGFQHALVLCPYPEILGGGARGGGKTDGILGKYAIKEARWGEHFNAVFFRKEMPSQDDLIDRAKQIYLPLGARYLEGKKQFMMPHGGRLRFRPMDSVADAEKYQGQSLTDAAVEEAGNYASPAPIDRLFGCLRSAHGVPVQLILSANPGGPGHHWIKQRFIDPAPLGYKRIVRTLPNGKEHHAVYIPSRVVDNRILMEQDPDYVSRLYLVGSVELVRAWLEGDWNVIAGAFFPEFSIKDHVIAPFAIPDHWARIRMADWGSARPFCILWGAISDGSNDYLNEDERDARGTSLTRGTLVIYREWYGWNGKANEGCYMTAQEVGAGIREKEAGEKMSDEVIDPAAFARDGGPSIAERMDLNWRRADNSRIAKLGAMGGWDEVRQRLKNTIKADDNGLKIFSTAAHLIRTLPALQHDPNKAEDVDCWVGDTLVSTPQGVKRIDLILPGEIVDTPVGPRTVTASYLSGTSRTIRVELADGRILQGTPHHKVMVKGHGLLPLSALELQQILVEKNKWSRALNIGVWCIAAIRGSVTFSEGEGESVCTDRSGSIITGLFRQSITFITRMATAITTTLRTSNACLHPSTAANISLSVSKARWVNDSRPGVILRRADEHCEPMPTRCSLIRQNGNARALIVESLLRLESLHRSIVRIPAKKLSTFLWQPLVRSVVSLFGSSATQRSKFEPARIVAVGLCDERTPVYNLTVEDARLFYANNVLSSNTTGEDHAPDTLRYGCMSRPVIRDKPTSQPRRFEQDLTFQELVERQRRKREASE